MIIETAVDQSVDLDVRRLSSVDAQSVLWGGGWLIHEYDPGLYSGADWDEAVLALEHERVLLAEIDERAHDPDSFYELQYELAFELELELGVSAACVALCAAGCPTFASCGGHDMPPRSPHPWIIAVADADTARLVAEAASVSGCGLHVDECGRLALSGPSIAHTIELAHQVVLRRKLFDALPQPARPSPDELREAGAGGD